MTGDGSGGWYFRWSFAYAQVLRDRDRRPHHRRRTPSGHASTTTEQRSILVDQDRLDGCVNFAYRALKSHRDGRLLEARLDAAESLPWLLDVVFTLAGRLRPYNKYLPWELREHPLAVPEWSAEAFLPEIERILAGDPAALRRTFAVVDREVRAWDTAHGTTVCGDLVDAWADELTVLRGVIVSDSRASSLAARCARFLRAGARRNVARSGTTVVSASLGQTERS